MEQGRLAFTAVYLKNSHGYIGFIEELPGVNSHGRTIDEARDTLHKLAMPWQTLFRALESTASDQVSLLAIEPEPKAGTVLISGEATTYHAALNYVALLGAADALERPHLVRHERKPDDTRDTVAFSVMASWGKAK